MTTTGPNYTSTASDDAGVGSRTWSTPTNAQVDDGTNTTVTGVADSTVQTHYLKALNFLFSIPAGSTINGVTLEIKKMIVMGTGKDNIVKLVKAGTVSGNDKADTATSWGTIAYKTYGSSADLWGLTLTPSDINDSTFGAVISASITSSVGAGSVGVDAIRITIDYTAGSVATRSPSGGAAYASPMFY